MSAILDGLLWVVSKFDEFKGKILKKVGMRNCEVFL